MLVSIVLSLIFFIIYGRKISIPFLFYLNISPVLLWVDNDLAMIIILSQVGILLGCIFHLLLFNSKNKKYAREINKKILIEKINIRKYKNSIINMLIFCVICSIFYFSQVGISLFAEDVGYQRLIARHDIVGSYFFQRVFRVYMPILMLAYLHLNNFESSRKYFNKKVFAVIVTLVMVFNIFTGMRGNVLIFVFFPILFYMGMQNNTIRSEKIAILFITTFVAGFIVTKYMYPDVEIIDIFVIIFERVSYNAVDGISYILGSERYQGLWGSSYYNDVMSLFYKLKIISTEYMNLPSLVASDMLGEKYNGEQAAVYFFGELVVNFGVIGVVIGSLIIGILISHFHFKVLSKSNKIIDFPIFVYAYSLLMSVLGGPSISMAIDYFITIMTFYLFYKIFYICSSK
jgi:oligosaccharide repeat unit polymerase